ncbi:MAG: pyridoxamine 5'-phosphate oxidase family protein [Chitinophagaceae bacterium]|nr:pyridoxamine 5'-phosphate oxidase family protein [Chitinophagaceae bacterium]
MSTTNSAGVTINDLFYTLEDLDKDCWVRLLNGALKSKDEFHTAAVATLQDGDINFRTMVLRKVIPQEKQIHFHTDIRSKKWEELQQSNNISLLFYNAAAKMQMRINGQATLHCNNAITETAWEKTGVSSRHSYLTIAPPSIPSAVPTSGLDEAFALRNPTQEESEAGKHNFGVISVQALSLDWLWLHHAGHRRAFFDYKNQERCWLIP